MYRYSTLIFCKKCGMPFRAKMERKKVKYLCSGYERFGKAFCERHILKEEMINQMIVHKFLRHISDDEVKELLSRIYVDGKFFEIFYKDGTTQLVQKNLIKFL